MPPTFDISKFQKALIIIVFFQVGLFYCYLNTTLYYGLHSPITSGILNLSSFFIMSAIFLHSLFTGEFGKINASIYAFVGYTIMAFIVIMLYVSEDQVSSRYDGGMGAISDIYYFATASLLPVFCYLAPPARFMFILKNSWLLFVPALISALLVIFLIGDLALDHTFGAMTSIGRSSIKTPIGILMIMSACWFILGNQSILKMVFGLIGMMIAFQAMRYSSSQSLIISTGFSFFVIFILSFKSVFSLIKSVVIFIVGVSFIGKFVVNNVAIERLMSLLQIREIYTFGGSYDISRLELAREGFQLFLSSPIYGGNAYLPDGSYTHFFPSDVLMATGLIGAALCCIVLFGMFKGIIFAIRRLKPDHMWIVVLSLYFLMQAMFHGSLTSVISMHTAALLALNMMRTNNVRIYPDEPDLPLQYRRS